MSDTLAGNEPSVFPPGPSRDHPTIPLGRGWYVAGTVVGAIVVVLVAAVIGVATGDEEIVYRDLPPTAVETDAVDASSVRFSVQVDPDLPRTGRIQVDGDDLVRVDVTGDALCAPVSGTAGGWIDVRFCGPLDVLTATAYDIDDETTRIVASF